jgi:hypothetical protein
MLNPGMDSRRGEKMFKVAPLPGSFMVTSIIGFFLSVLLVFQAYPSWGTAFALVFILMFISSMISMTYADISVLEDMDKKKR